MAAQDRVERIKQMAAEAREAEARRVEQARVENEGRKTELERELGEVGAQLETTQAELTSVEAALQSTKAIDLTGLDEKTLTDIGAEIASIEAEAAAVRTRLEALSDRKAALDAALSDSSGEAVGPVERPTIEAQREAFFADKESYDTTEHFRGGQEIQAFEQAYQDPETREQALRELDDQSAHEASAEFSAAQERYGQQLRDHFDPGWEDQIRAQADREQWQAGSADLAIKRARIEVAREGRITKSDNSKIDFAKDFSQLSPTERSMVVEASAALGSEALQEGRRATTLARKERGLRNVVGDRELDRQLQYGYEAYKGKTRRPPFDLARVADNMLDRMTAILEASKKSENVS